MMSILSLKSLCSTIILIDISDKSGQHGKVVRLNTSSSPNSPVLSATEGFRVNLLTHNAIEVGLTNSNFSTIFVAPREVYSDIHEKSVLLIIFNRSVEPLINLFFYYYETIDFLILGGQFRCCRRLEVCLSNYRLWNRNYSLVCWRSRETGMWNTFRLCICEEKTNLFLILISLREHSRNM